MLESVQRRATKLVKQFKGLDYKTRFENLNLTALEDTRPKGDLIQYYKKYSGTNIINWHVAPTINNNNRSSVVVLLQNHKKVQPMLHCSFAPSQILTEGTVFHLQSHRALELPPPEIVE